MIPKAYFSHEIPGRMRLRIPSKKQDSEYFKRLEKVMRKLRDVDQVQVRALTGSVLIIYHGNKSELRHLLSDASQKSHLFRLMRKEPRRSWADQVLSWLDDWDAAIFRETEGTWDLASLSAAGIAGIGLFQITQKEYFPPAWSLFGDAFQALLESRRRKRPGGHRRGWGTVLKTDFLKDR